jgi:NADH-quinone oxidoreductase subunit J
MEASVIIFYLIAAFILGFALMAVTSRKIFRSAIWLLASLVGIAALYFWMELEFIAAVQIVVYVGGIVVLIIFSIFLTQKSSDDMPKPAPLRVVFSALAALFGLCFTGSLIWHYGFQPNSTTAFKLNVADIGTGMLDVNQGYLLPFETVSILLLAAMIGCIVIALKTPAQQALEKNKKTELTELV